MILEGHKVAASVYEKVLLDISLLPNVPKLVVILVGEDPASQTYVRSKTKKCLDLGLRGETVSLPATATEAEIVAKVHELNRDKEVTGILVQLPLPAHVNKHRVIREIDPMKDVDGLHPENLGRLLQGEPRFVGCTPAGVIEMLKFHSIPMSGANAVVIGRSEIVGKPMGLLLQMNDATVTLCHSRTQRLEEETRRADILVVAMGKPRFIGVDHVKPGAAVIDVGIHRLGDRLVGDVDFEAVSAKASAITPVPKGVGPMTIAMLMKNLVTAAALQSMGKASASRAS